ncbi:MAG: response regulator [Bacteroidota bacterium]
MSEKTLQVVLIDDEPKSRQTLRVFLDDYCPEVTVVGEADSVRTGFQLLRQISPDAVFLDVEMLDGTGFDLLKKISQPIFSGHIYDGPQRVRGTGLPSQCH